MRGRKYDLKKKFCLKQFIPIFDTRKTYRTKGLGQIKVVTSPENKLKNPTHTIPVPGLYSSNGVQHCASNCLITVLNFHLDPNRTSVSPHFYNFLIKPMGCDCSLTMQKNMIVIQLTTSKASKCCTIAG